jgi:SAM-dependent methyltransferase
MPSAIGDLQDAPRRAETDNPNGKLFAMGASGQSLNYDPRLFARLAEIEERSYWFRARNRLIVEVARDVTHPGDRALEVGCGTGYVLRALVRECGLRATGCEPFGEALEHARRRVPEAEFATIDVLDMQYEDRFDLVGAFDVLEHIGDDLAALRGMRRAARPGGFVLLTVPQHPWLWSDADAQAHHQRRYRRSELVERVIRAGLVPARVTSFVTSLLPAMTLARLGPGRGRDPLAGLVVRAPLSRLFESLLAAERALIRRGVSLPAGGSLLVLAQRPLPAVVA